VFMGSKLIRIILMALMIFTIIWRESLLIIRLLRLMLIV
jgi:hypothetical protein